MIVWFKTLVKKIKEIFNVPKYTIWYYIQLFEITKILKLLNDNGMLALTQTHIIYTHSFGRMPLLHTIRKYYHKILYSLKEEIIWKKIL